jgi:DegV family protein with EDD domain
MKKVVIVTDSSANVPPGLVQQLDIRVVPIVLAINGYAFQDGVDITPAQVYSLLREGKHAPTTSAPSIGDFLRVYVAAAQEAACVVSIHLSPSLSATYNVAVAASQLVEHVPVRVVDCPTAAMGQGFAVLEAARAAAAGAGPEAVIARAREVASKVQLLATIDTLEHLRRGGRIGGAAALLGAALRIKPVLSLAGGRVDVVARPRTQSRSLHVMLREMAAAVDSQRLHAAVLHASAPEEAEELRQRIERQFDCSELLVTELTPVMGAHTGPGVLGVAFYVE